MQNARGFVFWGIWTTCLVGLLFWKGNDVFGRVDPYLSPVLFLTLFSVSVLTCALLVFYKPYKLFFEGKKTEAINLVVFTTAWLFFFLLLILALMLLIK